MEENELPYPLSKLMYNLVGDRPKIDFLLEKIL